MERQELEELLRNRLADAKLRLEFARIHLNEVQRDFPFDDPSPDGQYAYRHALREENFALVEYHQILRVYTELLIDGKAPNEGRKTR